MSEKRILALLGFVIGLVAGVLLLVGVFQLGRGQEITLDLIAQRIVELIIALVILFASLLIYRGQARAGGFVNLILGVVILFLPGVGGATEAALAIISGLLGLIASEMFR